MKSLRQSWLNQKDAHAQFQLAWQEAALDQPLPSERQEYNYCSSGLIQSRCVSVGTEYEKASVWAVAQVLARSEGKERLVYATPDGPWADLWGLYRRFSDEGVVVLGNTAYIERVTGLSRRTLQRALGRGDFPSSQVGYTSFVPVKAVAGGKGMARTGSKNRGAPRTAPVH